MNLIKIKDIRGVEECVYSVPQVPVVVVKVKGVVTTFILKFLFAKEEKDEKQMCFLFARKTKSEDTRLVTLCQFNAHPRKDSKVDDILASVIYTKLIQFYQLNANFPFFNF